MTEELKPSDVLDHAANLIDEWGWRQFGYLRGADGAMCHLGAIYAASGVHVHHKENGRWTYSGGRELASFPLAQRSEIWDEKAVCGPVADWNDHVCQSKDEAVAMLRKAAAMARGAGE